MRSVSVKLRQVIVLAFVAAVGASGAFSNGDQAGSPAVKTWRMARQPEVLGWSPEGLQAVTAYAKETGSHSYLLVDGSGAALAEWGPVEENLEVFSVANGLISALCGIYADEGLIDLQSTLSDLGIDDIAGLADSERQARVIHLLESRSGVYHPAVNDTPDITKARPARGSYAPGEHWHYNNWDYNALSTILEASAGVPIFRALANRLADPLGMEDYSPGSSSKGFARVSMHPALLLRMSTRDLARVGLLMLHQGRWGGEQLVPADWVAESTRTHSDLGARGGFGFGWWTAPSGHFFPGVDLPEGSYLVWGAGSQILLVMPRLSAVLVYRGPVVSSQLPRLDQGSSGGFVAKVLAARLGAW